MSYNPKMGLSHFGMNDHSGFAAWAAITSQRDRGERAHSLGSVQLQNAKIACEVWAMNNKRIRSGKLQSSDTKFSARARSLRSRPDRKTDNGSRDVFTAQDFAMMIEEFKRKREMPTPDRNAPRKAMVVAVPLSLIAALKQRSYEESRRLGRRVTQQELAESALRAFLYEQ